MNYYADSESKGIPDYTHLPKLKGGEYYLPSEALQRAVNLALFLGQPLLLTGEPGTGKTELAHHLIRHFIPNETLQGDRFFVFNTKTTSTAQDLCYQYDSLRHFHYVQTNKDPLSTADIEKRFIRYQALGQAIKSGERCVVLIDEIDKAPRDFPNDLLDVMDDLSFEVPELGHVGDKRVRTSKKCRPIVILTSNSEKNLPDAFLRRCVFFHIDFPDDDTLCEILKLKVGMLNKEEFDAILKRFHGIRNTCQRKKPSTAELLQWATALEKLNDEKRLDIANIESPSPSEKEEWHSSYSLLVKDREDLKLVLAKF